MMHAKLPTHRHRAHAVMAAVAFLGERFTVINGVGLCILIAGVVLFNFLKYRKIRAGEVAVHTATPRKSIVLSPRRPPDGAHLLVSEPAHTAHAGSLTWGWE